MRKSGMAVDCSSNFSYSKVQQWINSIPQSNENSHTSAWSETNRLRSASQPVIPRTIITHDTGPEPKVEISSTDTENGEKQSVECSNGDRRKESIGTRRLWMKAMHSAQNSFSTCTTEASSIDQLLDERRSDPEEVLMNLGFYQSNNLLSNKLPARFLTNKTNAAGIDLSSFYKKHPDLEQAGIIDSVTAMEQLYPRVPENFKKPAQKDPQTSLHAKFSSHSNDDRYKPSTTNNVPPTAKYSATDGTPYHTILTRQNSQTLEDQGFYNITNSYASHCKSPAGPRRSLPIIKDSFSTPATGPANNVLQSKSAPTSSPVFSPTSNNRQVVRQPSNDSSYTTDSESSMTRRLRAKLEAIQEKSLQDMEDDVNDGISFVLPRSGDDDVMDDDNTQPLDPLMEKRKTFATNRTSSLDDEFIDNMLNDNHMDEDEQIEEFSDLEGPIVFTLHASDEDTTPRRKQRLLPKQTAGLLQVAVPDSFDSVDSDTGTIVPSNATSPMYGRSPNMSRATSMTVINTSSSPPTDDPSVLQKDMLPTCNIMSDTRDNQTMQSFSDVTFSPHVATSCDYVTSPKSRNTKLSDIGRSSSLQSDSDSSGIADVDSRDPTQSNSPEMLECCYCESATNKTTQKSSSTDSSKSLLTDVFTELQNKYVPDQSTAHDIEELTSLVNRYRSLMLATNSSNQSANTNHLKELYSQAQNLVFYLDSLLDSRKTQNLYSVKLGDLIQRSSESSMTCSTCDNSRKASRENSVETNTSSLSTDSSRLGDHISFLQTQMNFEKRLTQLEIEKLRLEVRMKNQELSYLRSSSPAPSLPDLNHPSPGPSPGPSPILQRQFYLTSRQHSLPDRLDSFDTASQDSDLT